MAEIEYLDRKFSLMEPFFQQQNKPLGATDVIIKHYFPL